MTTVVDASEAREGDRIDSRFSIEDYENLPNDGKRYEIIEGELIVKPAPNTRHQRLSRRLQFALYEASVRTPLVIRAGPS